MRNEKQARGKTGKHIYAWLKHLPAQSPDLYGYCEVCLVFNEKHVSILIACKIFIVILTEAYFYYVALSLQVLPLARNFNVKPFEYLFKIVFACPTWCVFEKMFILCLGATPQTLKEFLFFRTVYGKRIPEKFSRARRV